VQRALEKVPKIAEGFKILGCYHEMRVES